MTFSPLIDQLISNLCCLPGVGPKTAQRMALHLLERCRDDALSLSATLKRAMSEVGHCKICRCLCETQVCKICANEYRNASLLCIVESPADVLAIEQTGYYDGYYFVLMGHLSPIDGIGPDDIAMGSLLKRAKKAVKEVILATNPTVEGETTAHYISEQLATYPIKITRIAHGVPIGGELEYIDGGTLTHAFADRKLIEKP